MFTVGLMGKLYDLNFVIKLFFNVIVIILHYKRRWSRVALTAFTRNVSGGNRIWLIIVKHTRNFYIHTFAVVMKVLIWMHEVIIS